VPARGQGFDLSKKLSDISKMYEPRLKWKAAFLDVFDDKLKIFADICQKVGLPPENWNKAFSFMLDGKAHDYYYRCILKDLFVCDIPPSCGIGLLLLIVLEVLLHLGDRRDITYDKRSYPEVQVGYRYSL
jgi:ligand-binding SRPBCC domain-containing protein